MEDNMQKWKLLFVFPKGVAFIIIKHKNYFPPAY